MTYATLNDCRADHPDHYFVRLSSGRWCATLTPPCSKHTELLRGKTYTARGCCDHLCFST